MYEFRFLGEKNSSLGNTQTYVVHKKNDPGNSVLQVSLFKSRGRWHAWTGCYVRRNEMAIANSVAETLNWLEGNPIG